MIKTDKQFRKFIKEKKKKEDFVNDLKDKIIGMKVEKAEAIANKKGIWLRTMKKDGICFIGIADFRTDRINLVVEDGKIVETDIG